MPLSKQSQVASTRSPCVSWFGVHRTRRAAMRCNPTYACCCGMVPHLFEAFLAGSIDGDAGPFLPGIWMVGLAIARVRDQLKTWLELWRIRSTTLNCAPNVVSAAWEVGPHLMVSIAVVVGGESQSRWNNNSSNALIL